MTEGDTFKERDGLTGAIYGCFGNDKWRIYGCLIIMLIYGYWLGNREDE